MTLQLTIVVHMCTTNLIGLIHGESESRVTLKASLDVRVVILLSKTNSVQLSYSFKN